LPLAFKIYKIDHSWNEPDAVPLQKYENQRQEGP